MPLYLFGAWLPLPPASPFWPGVGGLSIEAEATLRLPPGPLPVARGRGGRLGPFLRTARGGRRRRRRRRRHEKPGGRHLRGEGAQRLGVRSGGRLRRPLGPREPSPRWTVESCFVASRKPGKDGLGPGSRLHARGSLPEPQSRRLSPLTLRI